MKKANHDLRLNAILLKMVEYIDSLTPKKRIQFFERVERYNQFKARRNKKARILKKPK